jgi:8-oxo-dGTP pyrophosphatase MutT (NUDIX family)
VPVIHRARSFSVEVDRVRFPNGRTHDVSIVRHMPSVVILALPDPDHVILIRQYRHSVARELWELPAGSLNEGETAEAATLRECEEEIRLVPRAITRLRGLFAAPGFCDEELIFFRATDLHPPPPDSPHHPDDDEDIQVRIVTTDEARRMAASQEIVDLKSAYGLTLL